MPKPPPRHSRESGNPAPNATGIHRKKQKPNRLDSRLRGNDAGAGVVIPAKAGIQPPTQQESIGKNRNPQTVIPTEVGIQ